MNKGPRCLPDLLPSIVTLGLIASECAVADEGPQSGRASVTARLPEEAHSSRREANRALPVPLGEGTKEGSASAYWSPWKQMQEHKNPWVETGAQVLPGLPKSCVSMPGRRVCVLARLQPRGLSLSLGSWPGLWAARMLETWVQVPADPSSRWLQAAEEHCF